MTPRPGRSTVLPMRLPGFPQGYGPPAQGPEHLLDIGPAHVPIHGHITMQRDYGTQPFTQGQYAGRP